MYEHLKYEIKTNNIKDAEKLIKLLKIDESFDVKKTYKEEKSKE